MSNLKDKILSKDIKINKDKTSVTVTLKVEHCTWRDGDRPLLVDDSVVTELLIEEGYDILAPTKSASFYNDFSGKEKVEDKVLEWEFSLKGAKKPQPRKKTTAKTNLTKETKSVTVTQEDQQEDSESVE